MSLIKRTLPGIASEFFAQTQDVADGNPVILNGTGFTAGVTNPYLQGEYFRNLSFTSPDDLSAVDIQITGTSVINGIETAVTETLSGPNATTVHSTKCYSTVGEILLDGAATNLSVGSGNKSVIAYKFGERITVPFALQSKQDAFQCYITNPNGVTIIAKGTLEAFVGQEILTGLADVSNGIFDINNTITGSYLFTSQETRPLATIYFSVSSTGADPIIIRLLTA